ncbi:MAG: chemotaxis protein CheW [Vulcanimicrobiota bacterium]
MSAATGEEIDILLCRAGGRLCALRLADVVEIMRPLAVEPVAKAPPCVDGLALIRGRPCPVFNLGELLGGSSSPQRFVLIRVAGGAESHERRLALAVTSVEGVGRTDAEALIEMPPLLSLADAETVEAISILDRQLVTVLRAAALISEEAWSVLEPT